MAVHVELIRIDRQGYDRHGRYWGVGERLYHIYDDDEVFDTHVRASDSKEAKALAAWELKRRGF